jgi:branched-chain amino acid transport system substrate-binding protein
MALAGAGCGGSSSTSTDTGGASTSSSGQSGNLAKDAARFQSFVGGTAGKADASKPAVTLGYVNDEGGTISFPEGSPAADAAVNLINNYMGGINGAPLKLKKCLVATGEEQGQGCAQQFANDASIPAVVEGVLTVGAGAFHKAMAGAKPVVIASPNTPDDATAKNVWPISAGVFGTDPGFVSYSAKTLHAKTASLLYPGDDPTGQVAAKQIAGDLQKAGVKVTQAGYKSDAPSMLAQVTASGAGKTDVTLGLFPSPATCIAGEKGLQNAVGSKPVLSLGLCLADPVKKALGDFPKWTYVSVSTNPLMPSADPDVAAYVDALRATAGDSVNVGGFAPNVFMAVMTAAKAANAAGANPTAAKMSTAVKAITGAIPMHPPTHKAGFIPGLPSLTTVQTRLYTYDGDGKFTDATGGKWIP